MGLFDEFKRITRPYDDRMDDEDYERERGDWAKAIKTPYGEQMLIDYIAEVWQLEFEEVKE